MQLHCGVLSDTILYLWVVFTSSQFSKYNSKVRIELLIILFPANDEFFTSKFQNY